MAIYQISATTKRTNTKVSANHLYEGTAQEDARKMLATGKYQTILILIDRQGADHPSNSGKFFLHRIIK